LKQNKALKPAMIALPTLHLTVLVMHIADDMQLNGYTLHAHMNSLLSFIQPVLPFPPFCPVFVPKVSSVKLFSTDIVGAVVGQS